jgi:hypothetical protein
LSPIDWSSAGTPKKLVEYRRVLIYASEQGSAGAEAGGGNGDAARGEISGGRWLRALEVA